ncbi:MAG: glycosyltransferase family 2 protein [Nanoarchaeota archaeon]|nr:glycosyltransferase family 2 protein [Nanoarchaeota archaeon]
MGVNVSIVLPCRNEEASLSLCLNSIKSVMSKLDYSYEIIVSDSSRDRSPIIARKLGARVIKHDKIGYGNALMEGFSASKGEIIVMADADNSYDFQEIPKFLEAIKTSDFVIGSRFKGSINKGAMPFFHRYLGNPILTSILKMFFHTNISDAHSGFRAIKKSALQKLDLNTTGMEFASEMIITAVKKRLKIKELPVNYHKRIGCSKMNSLSDGWKHLRFMLLYSPSYLFFLPGLVIFLLGLLMMILLLPDMITIKGFNFDIHFLILGSFLSLLGFQIILLGLYSRTYSKAVGFEEHDKLIDFIAKHISLERGLLVGLVFFFIGLIISFKIFIYWVLNGFPGIFEVRKLIFASTMGLMGIQLIFSSFFLSLMLVERK